MCPLGELHGVDDMNKKKTSNTIKTVHSIGLSSYIVVF